MRHPLALALVTALAAIAGIAGAGGAAETYPSRTITMSVPYAPGGPLDTLARILAERMRPALGQTVIIENVGGAGGSIGVGRVVRSAPDGYTIGAGNWGSHVANVAIYQLPYDVLKDLDPVTLLPVEPNVIVARKALPPNYLKELIAWLKQNPGKATVGIGGVGGGADVVGTYFQKNTGTRFQFVPYRGAAPIIQDLLAGHIDLTFTQVASALAQVRSGQLKAYVVMAKSRWAAAPDTPTIDEEGVPGLYASFWHGLWAPKGTPKDVIAKLDAAVVEALADPAVQQRFTEIGQEAWPRDKQTPAALAAQQQAEIAKWWPIIKAAGIKAE